jgi:hypothetical protein
VQTAEESDVYKKDTHSSCELFRRNKSIFLNLNGLKKYWTCKKVYSGEVNEEVNF